MKEKRFITFLKEQSSILFLLGVLVVWTLLMTIVSPRFATINNFANVAKRSTESGIVACGMTLVIVIGGFDLSVGANMALCAALCGLLYGNGVPFILAFLIVILVGLVIGVINAWLVVKVKVQAMIATLATMTALRSIVYGITDGYAISTFPDTFAALYEIKILNMSLAVYIAVLIGVVTQIMLSRTKYGRFILATGSNVKAALAAGINTDRVRFGVFVLSAFLACVAGLFCAARLSTASPDMGTTMAFDTMTATLLAGTSITGGKGSTVRAMIGVFIMKLVVNGLNLIKVTADAQTVIMGVLLILIVGFDEYRNRRGIVRKD